MRGLAWRPNRIGQSGRPRHVSHREAPVVQSATREDTLETAAIAYATPDLKKSKSMSKILVIEDQPQMRKNLVTILQMENFEVISAENGRRGIELAKSERPDLVL